MFCFLAGVGLRFERLNFVPYQTFHYNPSRPRAMMMIIESKWFPDYFDFQ